MLRISSLENGPRAVTLKLEGSVAGPWVAEVRKTCEKLLRNGRVLKLDLADVAFVDRAGINLFLNLQSIGAALTECSPFVAEQLKALDET